MMVVDEVLSSKQIYPLLAFMTLIFFTLIETKVTMQKISGKIHSLVLEFSFAQFVYFHHISQIL